MWNEIFTALLILYIFWDIMKVLNSPLRAIPGPMIYRIPILATHMIFSPLFYGEIFGTTPFIIEGYRKKYGKVVRIGFKQVFVFDSSAIKKIAVFENYPKPSSLIDNFFIAFGGKDNLICMKGGKGTFEEEFHKKRRRTIEPAFQLKHLKELSPFILGPVVNLCDKLEQLENQETDFKIHFQNLTLDVLGETAFGTSFQALDGKRHFVHVNLEKTLFFGVIQLLTEPFFQKFPFLPPAASAHRAANENKAFVKSLIDARKSNSNSYRKDLLQTIISATDPETGDALTENDVVTETLTFLLAGTETTASTLAWCLYSICKNQDVYNKLQNEVDQNLDLDELPSLEIFENMPYLSAVIKESLRLYPPVSGGISRETPHDDDVCGYFVPKGTRVSCGSYQIHRDENIWGKDAAIFNPERWLNSKRVESGEYFPFSIGRRNCIGKNFAKQQLQLVLAILMRRFNFTGIDLDKVKGTLVGTLQPDKILATCEKRKF